MLNYRTAKSVFDNAYTRQLLESTEGRVNEAARRSGLSKVTLLVRIKQAGVDAKAMRQHFAYLAEVKKLAETKCGAQ